MLRRVLVGVDGSAGAGHALEWAIAFGELSGWELLVGTAVGPDADAEARERAAASLGDWCAPLSAASVPAESVVLDGDARAALVAAATQHGADLIVVGTSGTGWFPALHLGHVAHYLALHAVLPVAVVPPVASVQPAPCFVVGIDGSEGSAHALRWVADVAQVTGGKVVAVHARIPWVSRLPATATRDLDPDTACQQWVTPLVDEGVPVQVEVVEGHAAAALAQRAADVHAGMVVVGARGAGGLRGLHIGSVGLRLLHHAHLPVVVVPGPT